jgi:hypothetical protein
VNTDWVPLWPKEHEPFFRAEKSEKFIGPPKMTFSVENYQTEKERVKANIEKNASIFGFPSSKSSVALHNFRPRQPEKEIHGGLRFTFASEIERIRENIRSSSSNYIQNKKMTKKELVQGSPTGNIYSGFYGNRPMLSSQVTQELYPELSQKTHFKAAVSNYLDLPDSLQTKDNQREGHPNLALSSYSKQNDFSVLEEEQRENSKALPIITRRNDTLVSRRENPKKTVLDFGSIFGEELTSNRVRKSSDASIPLLNSQNKLRPEAQASSLPSSMVKETLVKCNYIKSPNKNVKKLRQGDGIFSGDPTMRHRDVYESLFKKKN